jgi:hypothetical protein
MIYFILFILLIKTNSFKLKMILSCDDNNKWFELKSYNNINNLNYIDIDSIKIPNRIKMQGFDERYETFYPKDNNMSKICKNFDNMNLYLLLQSPLSICSKLTIIEENQLLEKEVHSSFKINCGGLKNDWDFEEF